jgi:hypothetical protein
MADSAPGIPRLARKLLRPICSTAGDPVTAMHVALRVDDLDVGDLISVGKHVMFFTVLAELMRLDGKIFDSVEDALSAARMALGLPGCREGTRDALAKPAA